MTLRNNCKEQIMFLERNIQKDKRIFGTFKILVYFSHCKCHYDDIYMRYRS